MKATNVNEVDKLPRVLVLTIGRINSADTLSNGLLLRNLFGNFPKRNVAQIYSSGNIKDQGFFGEYYQLGVEDRRFGSMFYRLKGKSHQDSSFKVGELKSMGKRTLRQRISDKGKQLLLVTGFYELIFRPRLSQKMIKWVNDFCPDIIFTQGYNLTFTILPLLISKKFQLPIAYYPADDWPDYCYRPNIGHDNIITRMVRSQVKRLSHQLVKRTSIHIAFNNLMKDEYLKRYGIEFSVLMQGDNSTRFEARSSSAHSEQDEYLIVATGDFSFPRFPLLEDLNKSCELLKLDGINVRAKIFPVSNLEDLKSQLNHCHFLQIEPCPSHEDLVSVLHSSDILFLPERFGENSERVRLSVSSKAHLFMFSGRAIVVYSDPVTGIMNYARSEGWASIVDTRSPKELAIVLKELLTDEEERLRLIDHAKRIASKNHCLPKIQEDFCNLLQSAF